MVFELSDSLINHIAFAMQNHEHKHWLDTENAQVVTAREPRAAEDRYLNLPNWTSADGFDLMTNFVEAVHHPVARGELGRILASGRGVFKQFKLALKNYPEIERQWRRAKDRTIADIIREWYNDWREVWGLERLAYDPEAETDDLLLSDFLFRSAGPELIPKLLAIDSDWPGGHEPLVLELAETPTGDIVGFCAIQLLEPGAPGHGTWGELTRLFVEAEWRGLGLGSQLLRQTLQDPKVQTLKHLRVAIPTDQAFLHHLLELEGFGPTATVWER